jgi:membrane-associated phospholipid phosphatase
MLWSDIKLRAFALAALAAGAATPTAAQQIPAPPAVRYEIRAWPDAAIAVAGVVASLIPLLLNDSVASPCPCDAGGLPAVDRGVVGPVATTPARWSDATLLATVGVGGAGLLIGRSGEPSEVATEDMAVYGEAVLVTAGLTQVMKTVIGRPRPYVYATGPTGLVSRDDVASFPSGHASTAFAAAASYWSIQQRHGQAGRHVPMIVGLFSLATSTAILRVEAHKHFPTDVIAGAVIGTAVGWALPQVHRVR